MKRLMGSAKTDIEDVLDVLWDFALELTRDPAVSQAVNQNNPLDKKVRVTTGGRGGHLPPLVGEAMCALCGVPKKMKAAGGAQHSDSTINNPEQGPSIDNPGMLATKVMAHTVAGT